MMRRSPGRRRDQPPLGGPAIRVRSCCPPTCRAAAEVEAKARRELAGYYAHLEATDRAIGRLLARVPAAEHDCGLHLRPRRHARAARAVPQRLAARGKRARAAAGARGAPGGFRVRGSGFRVGVRTTRPVALLDFRLGVKPAQPRTLNPEPETEMQRISMPSVVRLPHPMRPGMARRAHARRANWCSTRTARRGCFRPRA